MHHYYYYLNKWLPSISLKNEKNFEFHFTLIGFFSLLLYFSLGNKKLKKKKWLTLCHTFLLSMNPLLQFLSAFR